MSTENTNTNTNAKGSPELLAFVSTQNSFWESRKAGKIAVAEPGAKAKVKVAELNTSARKYDAITVTAKKDAELAKARRAEIMVSGGKNNISPPGYKTPLVKKKKAAEYSDDYSDDAAVEYSDDSVDTTPPKTKTPVVAKTTVVAKTVAKKTAPASATKTLVVAKISVAKPVPVVAKTAAGAKKTVAKKTVAKKKETVVADQAVAAAMFVPVFVMEGKNKQYIWAARGSSNYRTSVFAEKQDKLVTQLEIGNLPFYDAIKIGHDEEFSADTMVAFASVVIRHADLKSILFVPLPLPDDLDISELNRTKSKAKSKVNQLVMFGMTDDRKWSFIHVDHRKPNKNRPPLKNVEVWNDSKDLLVDTEEIENAMRLCSFLEVGETLASAGWNIAKHKSACISDESGPVACANLWNVVTQGARWLPEEGCRELVIDTLVFLLGEYLRKVSLSNKLKKPEP
jgi:hypothetical protein